MKFNRLVAVLALLSGCGTFGTQTDQLAASPDYAYAACPGQTGGEAFICAVGAIESKNASCTQAGDCVPVALHNVGCHLFCGEALVNASTVEGYRAEITSETLKFCVSQGKGSAVAAACATRPARQPVCVDSKCKWLPGTE